MKNLILVTSLLVVSSAHAGSNVYRWNGPPGGWGGGGGASHPGGGGPGGYGSGGLHGGGSTYSSPQAQRAAELERARRAHADAEAARQRVETQQFEQREAQQAGLRRAAEAVREVQNRENAERQRVLDRINQLPPQITMPHQVRDAVLRDMTFTLPWVENRFDAEGRAEVVKDLNQSAEIAHEASLIPNNEHTQARIKLMADFSVDTVNSVNSFLAGVAQGAYDGAQRTLISSQTVIRAVYHEPTLLVHLGENITRVLADDLTYIHAYQNVQAAVNEFKRTMAFGSYEQKGQAFGELAYGTVLGLATAEALGPFQRSLTELGAEFHARPYEAGQYLGREIDRHLTDNPSIRPITDRAHDAIQAAEQAAPRQVYHRLATQSPVTNQDAHATLMQTSSRELWGGQPRSTAGGGCPQVQAYLGPLPAGAIGYEFQTPVVPGTITSGEPGSMVRWYEGSRGVDSVPEMEDHVRIPIQIIRNTHVSPWSPPTQ